MLTMMVLLGGLFVGMSQPMSLVFLLIFITLGYVMYLYLMMNTFWYSFVIMIVMLSGILVVFTYMASMTPNESFVWKGVSLSVFVIMTLSLLMDGWSVSFSFISLKLWDGGVVMIIGWLVSFLLVVMLMVIWISEWGNTSMRLKFEGGNS